MSSSACRDVVSPIGCGPESVASRRNVQNLTMAATRNLRRNLTLDVRYVGTLSRKLYGNININAPNFLYNGLKEALTPRAAGVSRRC
jgi:hypothetical protein